MISSTMMRIKSNTPPPMYISTSFRSAAHRRISTHFAAEETRIRRIHSRVSSRDLRGETEYRMIWLLVLLLLILAIGGGVALSKFLFLLLVVALVLALFGAFGRTA